MQSATISKSCNITCSTFAKVLTCQKFLDWTERIEKYVDVEVNAIDIRDVFMFGPNVGFIVMLVDCKSKKTGQHLPGYVMLRGDAVAILTIVKNTDTSELFLILTRQQRLPVGMMIDEIPAGMMDEEQNIKSVALKELEEETGLNHKKAQIQYEHLGKFIPSAGGCDEKLHCGYILFTMSSAEVENLHNQLHGEVGTIESIRLQIIPFTMTAVIGTLDSKCMCACLMFLEKFNILPKGQFKLCDEQ